ncbi:acyltransferase family protein [Devosia sp.]|uniref:acyltransferase family protein n=1 Tax=Devosia sp. TaxID=1871048 RepID=UPI002AFE6135|nr:acyltransferase family protein [Devosia sp.]
MADSKRLDWVDMAKGISILLVVMMYAASSVGEDTGGIGLLHWAIAFATAFRMPEFFLISGLFLSRVIDRPWRAYADRRVVHYVYFYALWAVIHITFKVGLLAMDPAGAAGQLAWAVVQPYGVLWFIYMLAVVSAAAKLLHQLRLPVWFGLAAGAALQIAPVHTGSYQVDQFAEYFVYFYAGYGLAPLFFRLAGWAMNHAGLALAGLANWAILNAALVFSPGFVMNPIHPVMGYAGLPGLHLLLALIGTASLCCLAALLTRLSAMDWLRWLGAHSLVVYVAFVLPMGIARTVLIRLGVVEPTVLSLAIFLVAVVSPLVLFWLVERTGRGKFLFERPAWAHLGEAPAGKARIAPAE